MEHGFVRLMVFRSSGHVAVRSPPITYGAELDLTVVPAGWHSGSDVLSLGCGGIKWLSYAPNMLSTQVAQELGGEDALLVSGDGHILDGPTFGVAWTQSRGSGGSEVWHTPNARSLALLPSVTLWTAARAALAHGMEIRDATTRLQEWVGRSEADSPSELVALSSSKDVLPVRRVRLVLNDTPPSTDPDDGPHSEARFDAPIEPWITRVGRATSLALGEQAKTLGTRTITLEFPGAEGPAGRRLQSAYDAWVSEHGDRVA
jgi:hypothetical protein